MLLPQDNYKKGISVSKIKGVMFILSVVNAVNIRNNKFKYVRNCKENKNDDIELRVRFVQEISDACIIISAMKSKIITEALLEDLIYLVISENTVLC